MLMKSNCNFSITFLFTNALFSIYIFVFISILLDVSGGFNLDVENRRIFRGPPGSKFGHAVDFYRQERESLGHILAGAPTGTSEEQSRLWNITKGGAVYGCEMANEECRDLRLDKKGNTRNQTNGAYLDDRNNQMLGATIVSSKYGTQILACAPLYTYVQDLVKVIGLNISLATGNCYLTNAANAGSGADATEISSIRHLIQHEKVSRRMRHYDKLGSGLLGFSAATPVENIESLYLTMPGAWYFEGGLLRQGISRENDIKFTKEMERGSIEDDSTVGYSVATGDFSDRGSIDLALGAPRAKRYSGAVLVYNQKLDLLRVLEGQDTGAYFGASVALGDLNDDDLVDLIVGAPLFYQGEKGGLEKTKFEVGRVYIYLQTDSHEFKDKQPLVLNGQDQWGRFGSAVAFAGDLNGDYFGDIVVGAPWAGEDGRGVVYVYHGNKDTGINLEPVQTIRASAMDTNLRAFGWSIVSNRDMDKNGFPDVLCGAPDSNRAVLLRTRPIVELLQANLEGTSSVDLSKSLCLNSSNSCTNPEFELCVSYSSKGVLQTVRIDAHVTLDAAKTLSNLAPRAIFAGTQTNKKTLTFNSGKGEIPECKSFSFEISKEIVDKLNPIVVVANYTVSSGGTTGIQPVLSIYGKTQTVKNIQISKNCGQGKQCIPDLHLTGSLEVCKMNAVQGMGKCAKAESFTSNSNERLNLKLSIQNKGQDSFVTKLTVMLGPGVLMKQYNKPPGSPGPPIQCEPPISYESIDPSDTDITNRGQGRTRVNITCDIGNPLPGQTTNEIQLYLSLADQLDPVDNVEVAAVVTSMNNESTSTLGDNFFKFSIPIIRRPNLRLLTTSFPANAFYDAKDAKPRDQIKWTGEIGPNVTHIYQVQNDGYLTVEEARLDIYWPMSTSALRPDGLTQYLLYLSNEPRIGGSKGACSVSTRLNQENLKNDYESGSGPFYAPENSDKSDRLPREPTVSRSRRQTSVDHSYLPVSSSDSKVVFPGIPRVINTAQQFINAPPGGDMPDLAAVCRSTRPGCVQISCTLGPIRPQSYGVVQVSGWLWMNTLVREKYFDAEIRSVATLTTVKFGGRQTAAWEDGMSLIAMASLAVDPKDPTVLTKPVQWWIYVLAALIGLFILFLILLVLRKCGFFKRLKDRLGDGGEEVAATEMATLVPQADAEAQSTPTQYDGYKDTPASPGARYKWQDQPLTHDISSKTPLTAAEERKEEGKKFGFSQVL